jgi:hypothetical protein
MSSLATNETSHHYASTLGRSQTGSNGHPVGTMLPLGKPNTEQNTIEQTNCYHTKNLLGFYDKFVDYINNLLENTFNLLAYCQVFKKIVKTDLLFYILGTLNTGNHLAIGSNTLLPYKRTHGAANHYPSKYNVRKINFVYQ